MISELRCSHCFSLFLRKPGAALNYPGVTTAGSWVWVLLSLPCPPRPSPAHPLGAGIAYLGPSPHGAGPDFHIHSNFPKKAPNG